jgi:histidinol dehydrogenase
MLEPGVRGNGVVLRVTTLGELDAAALARLAPTIEQLAEYESLPCHAAAVRARVK